MVIKTESYRPKRTASKAIGSGALAAGAAAVVGWVDQASIRALQPEWIGIVVAIARAAWDWWRHRQDF